MVTLPKKYQYLATEPGPNLLLRALEKFGTREILGGTHNQEILRWAAKVNLQRDYTADEIPWCGLFLGVCAFEAGWPLPKLLLRAKEWLTFGQEAPVPMLGDVLVFGRAGGGHVGLYVGEDATHYHVLGGNQGNCVSIVRFPKSGAGTFPFLGARRPKWTRQQPANVRRVFVGADGVVASTVV
jgi:uncharacterized protein (TIGR02594 family)